MKIGIYGDSYASSNSKYAVKWYELLAEKLKGYNISSPAKKSFWNRFKKTPAPQEEQHSLEIYSLAASSLFYTYNQFVDTHHKQDLNIVMVTSLDRYTKEITLASVKNKHAITSEPQIDSLLKIYEGQLSPSDRNKLVYLRGWFKSVDTRYNRVAHDLMLAKMESLHPNTIFYPCFVDSLITPERYKAHGLEEGVHFAHSFWMRQLELLGQDMDGFSLGETQNMCGHMGPEFNEFFANLLYKRITTGKWDHSGMLDIELTHPPGFYYKELQ